MKLAGGELFEFLATKLCRVDCRHSTEIDRLVGKLGWNLQRAWVQRFKTQLHQLALSSRTRLRRRELRDWLASCPIRTLHHPNGVAIEDAAYLEPESFQLGQVFPDAPPIQSLSELAEFLEISSRELQWLRLPHRFRNPKIDHYEILFVRKRHGGFRILESPRPHLKRIQRTILKRILQTAPLSPHAFGFVPNRSPIANAQHHVAKSIVLTMDLKDFFPSISATSVFRLFQRFGYPFEVAKALTELCTVSRRLERVCVPDCNPQQRLYLESMLQRKRLAQGAPTSPMLSNLIASAMDRRLAGLAASCHGVYTRYADDLAFSWESAKRPFVESFATIASTIVMECGFQVNFHKTRIRSQSHQQRIAGVVVNQHTSTDRKAYERLKATLQNCIRYGLQSQNRDQHASFYESLRGKIEWVSACNPKRRESLLARWSRIDPLS